MRRTRFCLSLGILATLLCGLQPVAADEGVIGGVDLGVAVPVDRFWNRAHTGGVFSPFAGYMFNDYLGLLGQAQVVGFPSQDRGSSEDNDVWAFGAHVGPRLALPFGNRSAELYTTWQGGVFTGLTGDTPISRTSWGFSTGAGLNFRLTDDLLLGAFGRYNWLDQRVQGQDVQYVTGGLSLTYNSAPPRPAAAPAPAPAAPSGVKKKIVLRGVHFDFDKATIRPDARPVLNEALQILARENNITIIAEGYTDSVGTEAYNQRLSLRRALAVRNYLVAGGLAANRIAVQGFGESQPVASNATADGRAQNRRVELRIRDQ